MAKTTCKLCFRRFASPRALAGHMRSHSVAAAAARQQISTASSASTSFPAAAAATDEDVGFKKPLPIYTLRENPKRSLRVSDVGFSDHESEAESTPPRPKRAQAAAATWGEAEPVSSLSDAATPEEDVALSLMMLSRDSWPSVDDYSDDDESDGGYALPVPDPAPVEKRTRFQCGACKKVFRSYQALGGHRASVKKGKGGCVPPPAAGNAACLGDAPVVHECPFCFRVFGSGQALGGHKRAHMPYGGGAFAPSPSAAAKCGNSFGSFDLNVPVAFDDDFELSAVYDAEEFGSTRQ